MKLREMYNAIHVPLPMGTAAASALDKSIRASKKPMPQFSQNAVNFFKDKIDDKHAPILLSVFCMLFYQVLFDPRVGCVTMTNIKKEEGDNEGRIHKKGD
jgi:hypothetical protein